MTDRDYCLRLAREAAYAEYLCMLMLKPHVRRRVLPVIALDAELRLVAAKVGDEMAAHIRYAWWRENIEALCKGIPPRDHPLLKALSEVSGPTNSLLEPLVDAAQDAWPDMTYPPSALHAAVAGRLVGDAEQLSRWQRCIAVAERHHARHEAKKRPLLALKLLLMR